MPRFFVGKAQEDGLKEECRDATGHLYACGVMAARVLSDLIGDRAVTCDVTGRDRYGRALGTCYAGLPRSTARWSVPGGRSHSEDIQSDMRARSRKLNVAGPAFWPAASTCLGTGGRKEPQLPVRKVAASRAISAGLASASIICRSTSTTGGRRSTKTLARRGSARKKRRCVLAGGGPCGRRLRRTSGTARDPAPGR